MTDRPNPGSPKAVKLGCICPVEENRSGKGIAKPETVQFVLIDGCPVHLFRKDPDQ